MNDSFDDAIKELNKLSENEYEALAKRIADSLAEHDTASNEYRNVQHHHAGEGVLRLAGYNRERAHSIVIKSLRHYNNQWSEMARNEDFCDYILAFLCGDGMEVEWGN
jgi:hypothetical protein